MLRGGEKHKSINVLLMPHTKSERQQALNLCAVRFNVFLYAFTYAEFLNTGTVYQSIITLKVKLTLGSTCLDVFGI